MLQNKRGTTQQSLTQSPQQLRTLMLHDNLYHIPEFINLLTNTIIDFAVCIWLSEKLLSIIIQLFTVLRETRTFESPQSIFSPTFILYYRKRILVTQSLILNENKFSC